LNGDRGVDIIVSASTAPTGSGGSGKAYAYTGTIPPPDVTIDLVVDNPNFMVIEKK